MGLLMVITFLICSSIGSSDLLAQTRDDPLAFTKVSVIDVREGAAHSGMTVIVTGDRITAVGTIEEVEIPADAHIVDATGHFLIPGLWDMHVHAAADGASLFLANGVTGVRDMWGSSEAASNVRKATIAGEPVPRLVMAQNLIDGGTFSFPDARVATTPKEAEALVDSLLESGAEFLKVYDMLAPEVHAAILNRAREKGVTVAGHVPWQVEPTQASSLGQRSIEHMSGLAEACSRDGSQALSRVAEELRKGNREHALLAWKERLAHVPAFPDDERCSEVAATLRSNQTWLVPTLLVGRGSLLKEDSSVRNHPAHAYVSDERRAEWRAPRFPQATYGPEDWEHAERYHERQLEVLRLMHQAGVNVMAGTDATVLYAVPGFSLHQELKLLVDAGLTEADALRAATLSPAEFLKRTDSLGTVESGKLADLVLLDANPLEDISNTQKIRAVVANGRYFDRSELDGLLAQAEAAAVAPRKPPNG